MEELTKRYAEQIAGQISCFDRMIIQGSVPDFNYGEGMANYLTRQGKLIFDFAQFAMPLTATIVERAKKVAEEAGLKIDYVRKRNFRKEDKVKQVLDGRGKHSGLVWIFSGLESCTTYRPWRDASTGRCTLKPRDGKCLHYYFYFMDEEFGLCFLRVPTWAPFRVKFYCNGHNWLARKLAHEKIGYRMMDNAMVECDDWTRAQELADKLDPRDLHDKLDEYVKRWVPFLEEAGQRYHWSLEEIEYATDIVFRRQADLADVYGNLTRTAIHTVKPDNIATFLSRKLTANGQQEMGNRYNVRIEGTRIKHQMGKTTIKMYDKFGQILRIETTTTDVTTFRHYREVGQRDGHKTMKRASMKKSIYSLGALRVEMRGVNRRYLEFVSGLDDPSRGQQALEKLSQTVRDGGRALKGFNLFDPGDEKLLCAIARGEFNISGMQNRRLRQLLPEFNTGQVSRILKRLRTHGMIRKAPKSYRYYLTAVGKQVIALGLKLKNLFIIPELATAT